MQLTTVRNEYELYHEYANISLFLIIQLFVLNSIHNCVFMKIVDNNVCFILIDHSLDKSKGICNINVNILYYIMLQNYAWII